jgi:hypothetical protein
MTDFGVQAARDPDAIAEPDTATSAPTITAAAQSFMA